MIKSSILVAALAIMFIFTGCTSDQESSPRSQTATTSTSDGGWGSRTVAPTASVAPGTTPATVVERAGPLEGLHSPILDIDFPAGSEGVWNVNDFNDDNKPNNFENWTVPLGYDETVTYLRDRLNPHYTRPDGMPWFEGDETEGEVGERYVDWWWGVSEPELLVRPQEFGEVDETTVFVESRP
jgi:hypothetical protein